MNISSTLSPEYDLLQASKLLLAKNSIKLGPQHIKSHQDNKIEYNDLPWQAQLNCNCNALAELVRHCEECGKKAHRHYTLPPGHGANLAIKGNIITAHMSKAIKEASYRLKMIEYITTNAKGTLSSAFEKVDWGARAQASRRVKRDNRLTMIKLEFSLFATMSRRHQFDSQVCSTCPRCNAQEETFDHVLKCTSTIMEAISAWRQTIKAVSSQYSCPAILKVLNQGITSWINGWEDHFPPLPNNSDVIATLIYQACVDQHAIGWGQLICGRISKFWGRANALYRRNRFNSRDSSLSSWSANVLFHLWTFGVSRWISRNEFVYGKTEQEKAGKRNADINLEITTMFIHDQDKIRPSDSHLFELSKDERLSHTFEQKWLWVTSVQAAISGHKQTPNLPAPRFPHNKNADSYPRANNPTIPTTYEGRRPRVRFRGK